MVTRILVVLVVSIMLVSAVPGPALSHDPEGGCTPGYWKQEHHFDSWVGFSPSDTLSGEGFGPLGSLGSATLLEALQFGGGPGLDGATRILMRAAVAALLNASALSFGFTTGQVITLTNAALASGDRTTILNRAAAWDTLNNLGCPLNN